MAVGRRSKTFFTAFSSVSSDTVPVPKVVHMHAHGLGHADGVGQLHLAATGKPGGHDVLCHIAGGIGGADRSTLVGSLPEKAPPPWGALPP